MQPPARPQGRFFGHGIIGERDKDLITNYAKDGGEAIGQRIIVHERVLDERNRPIPGVLVEVWQANAGGRYRHRNEGYQAPLDPNFGGCGRIITDEERALQLPDGSAWRLSLAEWRQSLASGANSFFSIRQRFCPAPDYPDVF